MEQVSRIMNWTFTSLQKLKPIEIKSINMHDVLYKSLVQIHDSDADNFCTRLLLTLKDTSSTFLSLI